MTKESALKEGIPPTAPLADTAFLEALRNQTLKFATLQLGR